MSFAGKIKVEVHGKAGTIFKGCGLIGWKRRFDWGQIKTIRIANVYCKNRGTRQKMSLEGDKVVSFAVGVKASSLRFMFIALRLIPVLTVFRNNESGRSVCLSVKPVMDQR
jgi:hypothetical protein